MSSVDEPSELFKWQFTVEPLDGSHGYRTVLPSALSVRSDDLCQYEADLTDIRSISKLTDVILSTLSV